MRNDVIEYQICHDLVSGRNGADVGPTTKSVVDDTVVNDESSIRARGIEGRM